MILIIAILLQNKINNMVKEHQTAYGLISDGLIFLAHSNTLLMIQITVEKLVDQVNKKYQMIVRALSNKHLMILRMVFTLFVCLLVMKIKHIKTEA